MAKILIVYHSQTNNTHKMACAVADGAKSIEDTSVRILCAGNANANDLLWADGIIIGSPENFGYMAGMLKDFFDRSFYTVDDKLFRKPYAVFISAGNDGTGAQNAIEKIAIGLKLKKIAEPIIAKGNISEEILEDCFQLGATLSAGCEMGIF
ncbi:MAG: NAD(P)H-dependent oxidoreductase [Deltaproteobacteria bacterium]